MGHGSSKTKKKKKKAAIKKQASRLSYDEQLMLAMALSESAEQSGKISNSQLPSSRQQAIFESRHLKRQHSTFNLQVSHSGTFHFKKKDAEMLRDAAVTQKQGSTMEHTSIGDFEIIGGSGEPTNITATVSGAAKEPEQQSKSWLIGAKSDGKLSWKDAATGYKLNPVKGVAFKELMRVSYLRFFPKLQWFRKQMVELQTPYESGHVDMIAERDALLSGAVRQIMRLTGPQLRQTWKVKFRGEPAVDAGGVTREWRGLVVRELFDPQEGFFDYSSIDQLSYQININAATPTHTHGFRCLGRFIGHTLLQNETLPVYLVRPLFKHIVGAPVTLHDLAWLDAAVHSSMVRILQMPPADVEDALCLDFSLTVKVGTAAVRSPPSTDESGAAASTKTATKAKAEVVRHRQHELKPGGSDIALTGENREEFVALAVKYFLYDSIKPQLQALLDGIYEVVPHALLSVFDCQELELVLCGLPDIDVEDWQAKTTYSGGFTASNQTVRWFFDVLRGYSHTQRAKMLQFVTGTSRVPVGGFGSLQSHGGKVQQFTMKKVAGCNYPRAHTCFNRIELPEYKTKAELKAAMDFIICLDIAQGLQFDLE